MKVITVLLCLFFVCSSAFTQVKNYAVQLDGTGKIVFYQIPEINQLSQYTIQFWLYPSEWVAGSSVFQRGDNSSAFEATLGEEIGLVNFSVGNQTFRINSNEIKKEKWCQLSVVVDGMCVTPYVNGTKQDILYTTSELVIPESTANFVIGKSFKGCIDEFRIWDTKLDDENYLLWDNTVNKYHPSYNSLVIYYKFDQDLCDNIVDYKFRHHGVMDGGAVRKEVTDNQLFKYRLVSAYMEFSRYTDVPTDADKYFLINDLVALDMGMDADGTARIDLPVDFGTLVNAEYIPDYKGRDGGILSLNGQGALMRVGKNALNDVSNYSFCTWMYIDQWTEGAYIFKKEKDDAKGISLRLGKEENEEVVLRVNGQEYRYKCPGELVAGKWIHLGVTTFDLTTLGRTFLFACNKKKLLVYPYEYPATLQTNVSTNGLSDIETTIGENFKGKLDETIIWNCGTSRDQFFNYADGNVTLPGPGKNVGTNYAFYAGAYWKYDRPEEPGYDYFSYAAYLGTIRQVYAGYRGFKIRISVRGGENWKTVIGNTTKRARLAATVAEIINNDKDIDGVDFDFEWAYQGETNSTWVNYGKLMEEVRALLNPDKILTLSPHSVAYWYPVNKMQSVDYFLFQNYGPSKNHFYPDEFQKAYTSFRNWGYPAEKIVMSFATTTSRKYNGNTQLEGSANAPVRIYNLPITDPSLNECNGYSYTGFDQTRWRTEEIKKNDFGGIMCWSLNCDYPNTSEPLSLFRAASFGLASNVDTLVTKVDLRPTGFEKREMDENRLSVYPNPSNGKITVSIPAEETAKCIQFYNMKGELIYAEKIAGFDKYPVFDFTDLRKDSYILQIRTESDKCYSQKVIFK